MAMAQLNGPASFGVINDRRVATAWVKRSWSDAWQFIPWLEPLAARVAVAPEIGEARFVWRYGDILQHYDNSFRIFTPVRPQDWYVLIVVHDEYGDHPAWLGMFVAESQADQGYGALYGEASGDQYITAVGLEHLFAKVSCRRAYVTETSGYVDYFPSFNHVDGVGASTRGNRGGQDAAGVYSFGSAGGTWTRLQMVEYLLHYHAPSAYTYYITGAAAALNTMTDAVDVAGYSLYDALNRIIDRRRGLGWQLLPTASGALELRVFGVFSGAQGSHLDLTNAHGVEVESQVIGTGEYDVIEVHGEPIHTCFSASMDANADVTLPGALKIAWGSTEQTAYDDETEDDDRVKDIYRRVYTTFRLDISSDDFPDVVPELDWDALRVDGAFFPKGWLYGKRFERHIPIEENIAGDDYGSESRSPEYREMMAFLLPEGSGRHKRIDRLDVDNSGLSNLSLRPLDRELGVEIHGPINHYIALNHFGGTSETNAAIDYDQLVVTVMMLADYRPIVRRQVSINSELGRTLTIYVPHTHYWYVAENTALDVDVIDGFVHNNSGNEEVVRDDTEALRQIADKAQEWYSTPRAILSLTIAELTGQLIPGTMIASSGGGGRRLAVNTVVTSVEWDFRNSVTRVRTGYSDLDFAAGVV